MEAIAKHRFARISPQKARLIADQVRGKDVASALEILTFSNKKSADLVKKVLESAILFETALSPHLFGHQKSVFTGKLN